MYHGAYFQDSWRATRRLTLHLGIRWEAQPGRTERFNRFNYFDFNAESPLARLTGLPLRGGLRFVDDENPQVWRTEWWNFAPRIGLAYKLTDKLVFRGGYGIFYPQTGGGGRDGYSTSTAWSARSGSAAT